MSNKIIPTIGRVVWYKNSALSDQMMAGTVAYVHNENSVNLNITDMFGYTSGWQNVPFHHGDAENCPEMFCCWMPYQKAQAEKNASAQR